MGFEPKVSLGGLTRRTRLSQALDLRDRETPAEERFWSIVRAGRVDGLKFRRQHQIGPWIVDFYCHELRLIVELVGSIHDRADIKVRDAARQKDLEQRGFRMLELVNEIVLNSPKSAEAELRAFALSLRPAPPPPGAGGAQRRGASRAVGRVGDEKLTAKTPSQSLQPGRPQ